MRRWFREPRMAGETRAAAGCLVDELPEEVIRAVLRRCGRGLCGLPSNWDDLGIGRHERTNARYRRQRTMRRGLACRRW
jgi:hypothetical protein